MNIHEEAAKLGIIFYNYKFANGELAELAEIHPFQLEAFRDLVRLETIEEIKYARSVILQPISSAVALFALLGTRN